MRLHLTGNRGGILGGILRNFRRPAFLVPVGEGVVIMTIQIIHTLYIYRKNVLPQSPQLPQTS